MSPSPLSTHRPLYALGALGLFLIVAYTLVVSLPYLRGPSLIVVTPTPGESVLTQEVKIYGKTERVSYLAINDLEVPLREDGTFALERVYPPGYTVLTVRARDRFGREEVRIIRFIHSYTYPYGPEEKSVRSEERKES